MVVCSIFVNPTQFNDPDDLKKYPRPIEQDTVLLEDAGCDILFLPEISEMYGEKETWHLDLGRLDKVLEAAHRPGHFQGVTQIVHKFFDLVKPDIACFGQKDFQQCMVIQHMVDTLRIPVQLEICPIIREKDGLAMSSRNVRLSEQGRTQALVLFRALKQARISFNTGGIPLAKASALQLLENAEGVRLEYFSICRARDLVEIEQVLDGESVIALVAAWVDGVRLIDNMILHD